MLNVESFRDYCLSKKNVTESFPFDETTLVFKVENKMFALVSLDTPEFRVNLKCEPEQAIMLREEYPEEITPGFHMSKTHWNTIIPNFKVTAQLMCELVDESYKQVLLTLPKKTRMEYGL